MPVFNGTSGNNTLNGSASDDTINGLGGADTLLGNNGNDILNGGVGNDALNGGAGTDTAVYTGLSSGYTLSVVGNTIRVTDTDATNGNEGIDSLGAVERVQFSDGVRTITRTPYTEFRVNTETVAEQGLSTIASLNDGGFVIVWQSDGQDGDARGIYGQRYNSAGVPVGGEFAINTHTTDDQLMPDVTALADGGFVVTWTSLGQDGSDLGVYAQRYAADGSPDGAEFPVNTTTTDIQTSPSVAALANGGFVVTWAGEGDGGGLGIYARVFAANGTEAVAEFLVNTETAGEQLDPRVTALGNGGFVVTWTSDGQDGDLTGVYAQRYDAEGNALGGEFRVNTETVDEQGECDIATLGDGGFLVAWVSEEQDGSIDGIYAQRYDVSGVAVGAEFRVNTTTADDQYNVKIASLADGGFVIVWESYLQDGSGAGVYAQRYGANGAVMGTEFRVNTTVADDQAVPDVVGLSDGGFIVTWSSALQDGDSYGVYAQRYDASGRAMHIDVLGDVGNNFLSFDGAARMRGGAGDDVYRVDNIGDVIVEQAAFGHDLVQSTISVTLSANVEALALMGTANLNGTGNTLDNSLSGNAGNNILNGGGGIDTATYAGPSTGYALSIAGTNLRVTDTAPTVQGNTGIDTLIDVERVSFTTTTVETFTITRTAYQEFLVNTTTADSQLQSAVTTLRDGGFVVVWTSEGQDGSAGGIYAQRYAANGARMGAEFLVNTHTAGTQMTPSVTGMADGGFLVSWSSNGSDGDGFGVSGQRFAADGGRVGAEFPVNTAVTNDQFIPDLTTLSNGGYVATWMSVDQDGSLSGIYGQLYTSGGQEFRSEFRINTSTFDTQAAPSVAALSGGDFVVVWQSGHDGPERGIYGQRYNINGAAIGGEFHISTGSSSDQTNADVIALGDGGFLVAWEWSNMDGSDTGIYAQRYAANGAAVGGQINVNTSTAGNQSLPGAAALADGGFVVVWCSEPQDGSGFGIYAQRYNAGGAIAGGEFRVNTHTTDHQLTPVVTALADGGFVVSWESLEQDGDETGIYAQRFDASGRAMLVDLQGDAGNNTMSFVGAARMRGGYGNDTYRVDNVGDTIIEQAGAGTDVVQSTVSVTLSANVENLVLQGAGHINGTGNTLNNSITGNAGNNILNGGAGNDTLTGGAGNDTYRVTENGPDTIIEQANAGIDTVESRFDHTLAANVENLVLLSNGFNRGFGNTLNNVMTGSDQANVLDGSSGNDILDGGRGSDSLIGGSGNDRFVYSTQFDGTFDSISDFFVPADTVVLDNDVFTALSLGTLAAGALRIAAANVAADADDRIIYNSTTGMLYYDSDGVGGMSSQVFARIPFNATITAADFVVVD